MNELKLMERKEKVELIKRTFFPGATDDEFELFQCVCRQTGLRPELKQIYPVKRKTRQSDGSYKEVVAFQTSIDGYRAIAEASGKYSPGKESTYVYDKDGRLISATAYVKKMTADGVWHEIGSTAFYSEYVQKGKDGAPNNFWRDMPHVMLAKCAESAALRKSFPSLLSGLYTHDEMPSTDVSDIPEIQLSLTEEQCAELDLLISEDQEAIPKILKTLSIDAVHDMKPQDFEKAVNWLKKRKEARENGSTSVA